ncbi:PilZ domain-containing protein [Stakelama saccharophila]|uniref:PilZ domain-containing protein n=1 Tax=Stakelama saccharophila TaxID=3075605 RepID=A0ABZ0B7K1_9SPHN|nr:PilZ domain-containing protein [Stakelama sp. W311]WNO52975.1 PilZ domain-containing protein [Stakelama sp. W311]
MEQSTVRSLRSGPRHKVFLPAEAEFGQARHRVHLLDLSRGGALLHSETPPHYNDHILLLAGPITRRARVTRVLDRKIGIAFVAPLSEEELRDILEEHQTMLLHHRERMAMHDQSVIR